MDWPNIKTILIVLLIVTNLLLGFIVVEDWQLFNAENESNLIDVLNLYRNNTIGVDLDFDALYFPKSIVSIDLDFSPIPVAMVQQLLGPGYSLSGDVYVLGDEIVRYNEMEITWSKQEHEGRVVQDREQSLRWFIPTETSEEVLTLINQFVEDNALTLTYDAVESRVLGDYSLSIFTKKVHNMVLEENRTLFWTYKDEVVGYKSSWPVTVNSTDVSKYDIISIDYALYSVIGDFEQEDTITDLSLVYKLNDKRFQVSNLISGEALPYYRFTTEKGKVVYVQAVIEP